MRRSSPRMDKLVVIKDSPQPSNTHDMIEEEVERLCNRQMVIVSVNLNAK